MIQISNVEEIERQGNGGTSVGSSRMVATQTIKDVQKSKHSMTSKKVGFFSYQGHRGRYQD